MSIPAPSAPHIAYTTPGMEESDARQVISLLQRRLNACNGLQLTLKHVHWNVVGPQFIAVHEMIDPQVEDVRAMADELAERIATLGGSPQGTPGALGRSVDHDYDVGRDSTQRHLAALDLFYRGIIERNRTAIEELDALDPVTQDILIDHTKKLELFHWFVRAHLEDAGGHLATDQD
ncbi:MAG: DNA starvation/stationary phase protection protein [Nocardioides sp.]|uniref:Dps family protein n=1 Tax=Nocardioides sp. TaxID=35761 RepID=UPI0039E4CAC7